MKTELGGGDYGELDVEVGAKEVMRIILEADRSMNGKFVNIHVEGKEKTAAQYDGGEIPW